MGVSEGHRPGGWEVRARHLGTQMSKVNRLVSAHSERGSAQEGVSTLSLQVRASGLSHLPGTQSLPPSQAGDPSSDSCSLGCGDTGAAQASLLVPWTGSLLSERVRERRDEQGGADQPALLTAAPSLTATCQGSGWSLPCFTKGAMKAWAAR